jgi:hypothetical protein
MYRYLYSHTDIVSGIHTYNYIGLHSQVSLLITKTNLLMEGRGLLLPYFLLLIAYFLHILTFDKVRICKK